MTRSEYCRLSAEDQARIYFQQNKFEEWTPERFWRIHEEAKRRCEGLMRSIDDIPETTQTNNSTDS